MKTLYNKLLALSMLLMPVIGFTQVITMGTTSEFALYTTNGAIVNTGISQITGNVGSNVGASTGFGNVNGVMDDQNNASGICSTDLLKLYNELDTLTPTSIHAPALGGGDTMVAGVYSITGVSALDLNLYLDAKGNSNALFVFQFSAAFSTGPAAKLILLNGAMACNVYWKAEGKVSLAAGTTLRGTIVANNAQIVISASDTLEGRALSIAGAVSLDGDMAYTPIGCGSPTLTGPTAPTLNGTACYAIFSGNGSVTNSGNTYITGDVGTNVGLTTGFNASYVTGTIHPIPDGSTDACASDLLNVYNYLNTLPYDIELLYPAQFGNNLVLTPHTYIMKAAVTFTDTLYLNAEGNANAVFVLQVNGACSTSTYSKVILMNMAQAKNVYWKIDGAVNINDYSIFSGTLICNNGAVSLNTGVTIDGRVLTTNGSYMTNAMTDVATMIPGDCAALSVQSINSGVAKEAATIYPNPCSASTTVMMNDMSQLGNTQLNMFNVLGQQVMSSKLTEQSTTLSMDNLPAGMYFYTIISNNTLVQSGKLAVQL